VRTKQRRLQRAKTVLAFSIAYLYPPRFSRAWTFLRGSAASSTLDISPRLRRPLELGHFSVALPLSRFWTFLLCCASPSPRSVFMTLARTFKAGWGRGAMSRRGQRRLKGLRSSLFFAVLAAAST